MYKICVYAICKNESKFVDRWYESVKEADYIYVLDTGSTDDTVNKLKEHGVVVSSLNISPFRFDVARNKSLELVPDDTDICVCIDLDEVFLPGWRKILEELWKDDTTRIWYIYNWKLENNKPVVSFYYNKIHSRRGYKWIYPVHEVLDYEYGDEKYEKSDLIVLNHHPDSNKSRGNYLELLELSVKENPNNDRNMHYLGREYMYYGRWNDAIDTLINHLKLDSSKWKDERAASMRFIGRCYKNMNRFDEAKIWYLKAINEASYLRDGYVELGMLYFNLEDYEATINVLTKALMIKKHEMTYINEIFSWDYTIYNLLSVSYYYLGLYDISLFFIDIAIRYDSNNEMLLNNREIIKTQNNIYSE